MSCPLPGTPFPGPPPWDRAGKSRLGMETPAQHLGPGAGTPARPLCSGAGPRRACGGCRGVQDGGGGTSGLTFLAPVQAGVPGARGSQPLGGDAISSGGLWGKVVSEFSPLSSGISHTAPKQPSLLETVGITLKTVLGLLGSFSGQTFPSVDRSHF